MKPRNRNPEGAKSPYDVVPQLSRITREAIEATARRGYTQEETKRIRDRVGKEEWIRYYVKNEAPKESAPMPFVPAGRAETASDLMLALARP